MKSGLLFYIYTTNKILLCTIHSHPHRIFDKDRISEINKQHVFPTFRYLCSLEKATKFILYICL